MPTKYVAPTVTLTAFNCPHCGVLTTQTWLAAFGEIQVSRLPKIWTAQRAKRYLDGLGEKLTPQAETRMQALVDGNAMLATRKTAQVYEIDNLNVSICFDCGRASLWIGEALVWPIAVGGSAPEPNADLPPDIKADYLEAAAILAISPRGAAALLRLCIQKLCKHLGEEGKNINQDIANLVSKGLHTTVRMALDVVRVIGNEAVHPGQLDLRDNPETAAELFRLVNMVSEMMISQPARLAEIYAGLPPDKLKAIVERDKPRR